MEIDKYPKYLDAINYYEGIITEIHDGAIAFDFKGRLGSMRIPMRMLISDHELKVGQEVALSMSFICQLGPEVTKANADYIKNKNISNKNGEKEK